MNIAKSSVKIAGAKITGIFLTFIGTAFFARELGASLLGSFFLFQAILAISALPADLGIRMSVEKRISEGKPPNQVLCTGIAIKSIMIILLIFILIILRGYIDRYIGAEITILLIISIIFQEYAKLIMSALQGELRVGETAILRLAYSFTWVFLGTVFIVFNHGLFGLIYAVIIARGIQLLWALNKTTIGFGRPSLKQASSLINYAKYTIIPAVDSEVHGWMDVLIIGFFVTQSAVGAYEIAWRVAGPVLLFTSAIGITIFPQISSWESDNSIESVEKLFPKIITPSLLFVFPAFFGGVLFSREILELIFGEEFGTAWLVLIILLAAKLPRAIRTIAGKSLLGLDRPDLVTNASIVDIIANILFNTILIWNFGIVGAALGTTISMTIGTVHRLHYLSTYINIRIPFDKIGWCFISSVVMFLILRVLSELTEITTVLELILFIIFGAFLYTTLISLYRPLRESAIEQAKMIISL